MENDRTADLGKLCLNAGTNLDIAGRIWIRNENGDAVKGTRDNGRIPGLLLQHPRLFIMGS
ncbi:MAG: hypothetical protein ACLTVC_14110 [Lachnospiraceae bacterium]